MDIKKTYFKLKEFADRYFRNTNDEDSSLLKDALADLRYLSDPPESAKGEADELERVAVYICKPCLDGVEGVDDECHTPGCLFWGRESPHKIRDLTEWLATRRPSAEPARDVRDDNRCAICGWPLQEGYCQRGDCAMRPFPTRYYDAERARKEYALLGIPDEAQPTSTEILIADLRVRADTAEAELAALKAGGDWIKGEPPSPWNTEWFFAKLKNGEYAVLHRLPEEYSYDYKTADETYLKKDNIVAWMQIPDSEFIKPAPSPEPGALREVAQVLLDAYLCNPDSPSEFVAYRGGPTVIAEWHVLRAALGKEGE